MFYYKICFHQSTNCIYIWIIKLTYLIKWLIHVLHSFRKCNKIKWGIQAKSTRWYPYTKKNIENEFLKHGKWQIIYFWNFTFFDLHIIYCSKCKIFNTLSKYLLSIISANSSLAFSKNLSIFLTDFNKIKVCVYKHYKINNKH